MESAKPTDADLRAEVDRLRAQVARLEQEVEHGAFLQRTLDSIDSHIRSPMFWKDDDTRYRWVNKAFADEIGKPTSAIIGRRDQDFRPADLARAWHEEDQRVLRTGQPSSVSFRRDQQSATIEVLRIPIVGASGRTLGLLGVERDVTVQEDVLANLEQDSLLLEVLMDTLPDSIYFKDAQSRFVRVNRSTVLKFGLADRAQIVGRSDFDFFNDEHAREAFEDERQIMETGQPIVAKEEKETWPNGGESWVSTTKVPVRNADGRIMGTFGVTRDVTNRKRAQMALEVSERRYRELIENANDIIYIHDLQGRILSINRAAENASGYLRSEATKLSVQDLVAPDHLSYVLDMTRRKLAGIPTTTYELDIVGKDGRRIPIEVSTQVLHEEGRPVAIQGIGRDITERKRASQALQQQAQLLAEQARELEQRNEVISKAYRELQDAESQLIHSEKMAAVGQLVAGLAHEINNPAAFVLTNLTTVAQDIDDILRFAAICEETSLGQPSAVEHIARKRRELAIDEAEKEARLLLESCRVGMHRIRDLVANLRSYSRIDTRGNFEIADLSQGIEATLVLLRPILSKEIQIDVVPFDIPAVECNLGQINQVFMNLIVNAADAVESSPRGTLVPRIVIQSERADDGIVVRVQDNGPGIGADIVKRIFDPFFTTKEVGKGTGLGLSICQRIVDGHGGRLTCQNMPDQGTEFAVWLPLRQPHT
ncbi:PAS domain S-box protein [bacterium]|nr:PAS domain S-box protein [bacterium]